MYVLSSSAQNVRPRGLLRYSRCEIHIMFAPKQVSLGPGVSRVQCAGMLCLCVVQFVTTEIGPASTYSNSRLLEWPCVLNTEAGFNAVDRPRWRPPQ